MSAAMLQDAYVMLISCLAGCTRVHENLYYGNVIRVLLMFCIFPLGYNVIECGEYAFILSQRYLLSPSADENPSDWDLDSSQCSSSRNINSITYRG